ncbi:hypothetical protein [Niallia sp. FSL R7-0271]|uniref:hypothetical protein n=1 Tax=unclassified Niallia TaxID=2837522 RepID=UPI0030FCE422
MIRQTEALAANAAIGIAGIALTYQEETAQDALLVGIQHLRQDKYHGVFTEIVKECQEPCKQALFL